MKQIIYADVIFLLNFCMDFLALFAAGKILSLKLHPLKLCIASALGALYCIFAFMIEDMFIPPIILHVLISVIMCLIAFDIKGIASFTKIFVIFYSACFMLGGGIEALYYLAGFISQNEADVILNIDSPLPAHIVLILAAVLTVIVIFAGKLFKKNSSIDKAVLKITFRGKEISPAALIDTGNLLRDPISGYPVIIIKLSCIATLFDNDMISFFSGGAFSSNNRFDIHKNGSAIKFRVIPVKTLSGSDLLPAFIPDSIEYKPYKGGKEYTPLQAVIAIDNKTRQDGYGGCECVIPAALLDT